MAKQGTEYELFVKEIYEYLNQADGLTDVEIQHDVKLKGASGVEHQVDIFWKFTIGGVYYKVAIECKDYRRPVSKEKIMAFHSVLTDIGNIHGIFASKMGYQKGAKEYAANYGIQLMEIRHPIESDWEGKIKDIHLSIHMRGKDNIRPVILVDKERIEEKNQWLIPEEKACLRHRSDQVCVSFDKMIIGDEVVAENSSKTMQELFEELPTDELGKDKKFVFSFENAIFSSADSEVPVTQIRIIYDVYEVVEQTNILGDKVIKAIVKNITDGTEHSINKFGEVKAR